MILENISIHTIVKDANKLYTFLSLFSLLQNIFIFKPIGDYDHGNFQYVFDIDQADLDIVMHWLRSLKTVFESQQQNYTKVDKRFEVILLINNIKYLNFKVIFISRLLQFIFKNKNYLKDLNMSLFSTRHIQIHSSVHPNSR